jgi:hypothetical protein
MEGQVTETRTFTISAHSLGIYDRCQRAYWLYKVQRRRAVRSQAGLIAGTAMHAAIEAMNRGGDIKAQELALESVIADSQMPTEDYRTTGYLKDALAAFRAELATLFVGWTIHEVESQGTVELGIVLVQGNPVTVLWEFRRDMVGTSPEGLTMVIDYKTASRNEEVEYLAMKNSGQLLGYCRSYEIQNGKPVHGAQPVRIILRKPTKAGVVFEFPKDGPIFFQRERLLEWQRHTLAKAKAILERNPEDSEEWLLAANPVGSCRTQFGACDYLQTCTLAPEDRMRHLMSDAYESSDHANTLSNQGASGPA